ncbi:hypothetical protein RJ639_010824 [Escallonia herrerae]|uniref:U-box domain-containing protein n=1 Tax=Escallonia herrerae TaxID=1293975 RepID=A0AA88VLD1_9ASTE|nr:hypothetical protein RJ639_010824 [Escallonia herrerae]
MTARVLHLRLVKAFSAYNHLLKEVSSCIDAASVAMDTEDALEDITDEFLDPIQYTLMKDPILLPTSKKSADRAVIERHLLSANNDRLNHLS